MHLSHRQSFRDTHLKLAFETNLIKRTIPDSRIAVCSETALLKSGEEWLILGRREMAIPETTDNFRESPSSL